MANLKSRVRVSLIIAAIVLMAVGVSLAQFPSGMAARGLWGIATLAAQEFVKSMASEYGKGWADQMLGKSERAAGESSPSPPSPPQEDYLSHRQGIPNDELSQGLISGQPFQATLRFAGSTCGIMPAQVLQLNLRIRGSGNGDAVAIKDADNPNGPVLRGNLWTHMDNGSSELRAQEAQLQANGCVQTVTLQNQTFHGNENASLALRVMCPTPDPRIPQAVCDFAWKTVG